MKHTIWIFLFCLASVSCSMDDALLPEFSDDVNDWNETLDEIMSDNGALLASQGFTLVDMECLEDAALDSAVFFSGEYSYYPAYSREDSTLQVLKYEDIASDADNTYVLDTDAICRKISRLLSDRARYDLVRLTWNYRGETFQTIALFNRLTCEFEYDNMLFNMATVSRLDADEMKQLLTRSEIQNCVESGMDNVDFYQYGNLCAVARMQWWAVGHWVIHELQDTTIRYYSHEYVGWDNQSWAGDSEYGSYDTYVDFIEISIPTSRYYGFRYTLWAGPKGQFNQGQYGSITLQSDANPMPASIAGSGVGRIETITNTPSYH